MQTIETTVYNYSELSEAAKEKAREWYISTLDYEWWDCVYEDAKTIAELFGLDIRKIYFSGFWSQGDGASFEGSYAYKPGSLKAVMDHAPVDKELHSIVQRLAQAQKPGFYKFTARIDQRGHYCHSMTMQVSVYRDDDAYGYVPSESEEAITQCLREYADWIYNMLEREYDFLCSEEAISDCMEANEYTFTENGKRFG